MSGINSSNQINERIVTLNNENSAALMDVMVKYDVFYTLLSSAGYNTTELWTAIKSALQCSVTLLTVTNDIILNGL
jgi:hypothetical protein